MYLLYFKSDKTSFREQRFFLEVISVKFMDWSKAQIANISAERPKMKKVRVLYFLELFANEQKRLAQSFTYTSQWWQGTCALTKHTRRWTYSNLHYFLGHLHFCGYFYF